MERVTIKILKGADAGTVCRADKFTENGKTLYHCCPGNWFYIYFTADMVEEIAPIETYYFIKSVSTATPENKNFAGEVHTYIFGKGGFRLFEDVPDGWYNKDLTDCPNCIHEYGYKRVCDAKRSYNYRNPQNDKSWTTKVKIVSLDIQKDKNGKYHMA